MKERKHGFSSDDAEALLCMLRECAHAPSPTDESLPRDFHFQQHVNNLNKSRVWQNNELVQEWLDTKWLDTVKPKVNSHFFPFTCNVRFQNSSFHKPISGVHTDPYEESSGVFHVL